MIVVLHGYKRISNIFSKITFSFTSFNLEYKKENNLF